MDAKLQELCRQAHEDRIRVGMLDTDTKNRTLELAADALMAHEQEILEANAIDMERGRERNMPQGLLDRLKLDHDRLLGMADGLRQVAKLEDPIGEVMSMRKRPNGLIIGKVRVAIGVVGIIFEARPNVTSDAFGLCFKSGNCAILKGGSDAIHSNIAIVSAMQEALRRMNIPKGALSLIESTDRETTNAFMKMKDYVDLLIPRGGRGLIQSVVNNATIPVIETGTGNCHVYVDQFADQEMAVNIIKNAKTQRIGVCNACESIVVHRAIAKEFLPKLYAALKEYDVEMRGDSYAVECLGPDQPLVKDATEEDWGTEYLDYILLNRDLCRRCQELLLASPADVLLRLGQLAVTAAFWRTVAWSAVRIFGGFLLATVLAVALAALAAWKQWLRGLMAPLVAAVKAVLYFCSHVL